MQLLHDHARKRKIPIYDAAAAIITTDELKPKARGGLRTVIENFERWRTQAMNIPHTQLAEIVLDESGYTEMWQKDRSADAQGRLDNLKELVRSMEGFREPARLPRTHRAGDGPRGRRADDDKVSIMTLHSAKGLEFDNVFLPGWEEGLFPSQRTLDDQGRAGLEEERRLAHVGLTRARRRAKLYFATNRRIHGTWSTTIPSRFLDELPAQNVEITESKGGSGWGGSGGYGASRFDEVSSFGSSYGTPGWQRAQANKARGQKRSGFGFDDGAAALRRERGRRPLSPHAAAVGARLLAQPRAAHHRRRADREIHRHELGVLNRRPRLPPEIRLRPRHAGRRQQADDRVRQGGREAGGG